MIFKKLERYSPRFHNSELGKKIKGTPSIFSPGCKDFVLQYVDKAQNFEKGVFFQADNFYLIFLMYFMLTMKIFHQFISFNFHVTP